MRNGLVRAPYLQVFSQRGFVAKLLLARSDIANLEALDSGLTKCLQDMGVGTVLRPLPATARCSAMLRPPVGTAR